MGCAIVLLLSFGGGAVILIGIKMFPSAEPPQTIAAPAPAPAQAAAPATAAKAVPPAPPDRAAEKRFEGCRAKLKKAQEMGMLHDFGWKGGAMPRVVVGPTFFDVPFDAKEGFAETVNCFLMTGQPKFISFDLLDWKTEKVVGRFEAGRLEIR